MFLFDILFRGFCSSWGQKSILLYMWALRTVVSSAEWVCLFLLSELLMSFHRGRWFNSIVTSNVNALFWYITVGSNNNTKILYIHTHTYMYIFESVFYSWAECNSWSKLDHSPGSSWAVKCSVRACKTSRWRILLVLLAHCLSNTTT